jgi:NAD+ synthase (glutamine-hydrolysing)
MDTFRLTLAQINPIVGDLAGNFEKIAGGMEQAREMGAHIVLFPELVLCGYPPEDLLLKPSFIKATRQALTDLLPYSHGLTAILGFVDADDDIYNAAAIIHNGQWVGTYRKFLLPNYGVFDEERYFRRGDTNTLYNMGETLIGISICEDIWYPAGPPEQQAASGAEVLLNISSSPYHAGKIQERERMLRTRATDNVAIIAYCNLVGGQDELIFDGSSIVIDERGEVLGRAKCFEEDFLTVDVDTRGVLRQRLRDPRRRKDRLNYYLLPEKKMAVVNLEPLAPPPPLPIGSRPITPWPQPLEEIYAALVMGTRDYIHKNGFKKVVIALSGGIDSSLVACIAADALGPENVIGVSMPSRYSSEHSKDDAAQLAENLAIRYETIPIEKIFQGYLDTLAPQFAGTSPNQAEENLQSRARGNILMALSNKFGWLVLTTGNKSEMAVGYATLYGDMAGGFAVIKDVQKTLVYDLCRYRNRLSPVIPPNVLEKPPSAELRPDQFDTDSLPPYDILDGILTAYVENDCSFDEIVALGYEAETVRQIIKLIDRNEYKRRQAPPGIKITSRAFGKDRRLPITNRYQSGQALRAC